MVSILVEMDNETAARAQAAGLLGSESIVALLKRELDREAKARSALMDLMNEVSSHMRRKYDHLTEEEGEAMIQARIDEADRDSRPLHSTAP